jgi:hypothetical protein
VPRLSSNVPVVDMWRPVRSHVGANQAAPSAAMREHSDRTSMRSSSHEDGTTWIFAGQRLIWINDALER